jgi:hypothetical protein
MAIATTVVAIGPPRNKKKYRFIHRAGIDSPQHNQALLQDLRSMVPRGGLRFVQPHLTEPFLDIELAPSSTARETDTLDRVLKCLKRHGYSVVLADV